MVKIRSDKVLESLATPEFPKDSEMVVYIHKLMRVRNHKHIKKLTGVLTLQN